MTRKEELKQELHGIEAKEMQDKLDQLGPIEGSIDQQLRIKEAKNHSFVIKGDFLLKFIVALVVSAVFMYAVIAGLMAKSESLIMS